MMKTVWKFLMGILVFALWPGAANAQDFTCAVSQNISYCQYVGKIKTVYINNSNVILLYFEQTVDTALPASVGYNGVSNGSAAAFTVTVNPTFAEYLYSTALTAFAADKTVAMQFRQTVGGYMQVDRIWAYQ